MSNGKLVRLLDALNEGLYEKEHVMALALLSAVAGESLFLLGPPGVAKSMIARRLKEAFSGASAFEYLMSRFSTPDELFGPVSITKLKDEDCYERCVEGYLPTADVVFLDEIWKAGPGIQNALLTVLNEKVYRNGRCLLHLPLKGLIAASNELPAEGEGLEALWDRFLLRCLVTGIGRNDWFDKMIADTAPSSVSIPEALKITAEEWERWREGIRSVALPPSLFVLIHRVRDELMRYNAECETKGEGQDVWVSDRRWKKAVGVLRASAFLNGRSEVCLSDAVLLLHVLWSAPEQIEPLTRLLSRAWVQAVEEERQLKLLQDRVAALRDELRAGKGPAAPDTVNLKVVQSFYYQLQTGRPSQKILMYTSEYQQLDTEQTSPYILVSDRYKTGAQILKRYEKSRYPGVFPKDILQVKAARQAVVVSGKTYPLVTETSSPVPGQEPQAAAPVDAGLRVVLDRLVQETAACKQALLADKEREMTCAAGHLFLDEAQKALAEQAYQTALFSVARIENELNELKHACGSSE